MRSRAARRDLVNLLPLDILQTRMECGKRVDVLCQLASQPEQRAVSNRNLLSRFCELNVNVALWLCNTDEVIQDVMNVPKNETSVPFPILQTKYRAWD
jgi:hypothetical protein